MAPIGVQSNLPHGQNRPPPAGEENAKKMHQLLETGVHSASSHMTNDRDGSSTLQAISVDASTWAG